MCVPRLSRSEWTSAAKLLRALLKQVVNSSKLISDEVQRAIGNSKRGIGGRALLLPDISKSSSSLHHVYGGVFI